VWFFNSLGEPQHRIVSCEGVSTTNLAFGGMAGKTLFITESDSGSVLQAEVPVQGRRMYSHM